MAELVEVNWVGLNYSVFDAIQSYLVEHPDHFYLCTNKQWLCWLTRDKGMIKLVHDFTNMNDIEISNYIVEALEVLYHGEA